MEIEESAVDRAKRMMKLELECEFLLEEKINLEIRLMELENKEQRMKEKCMKRKRKCAELREKFDSEEMKWREENQKISDKYWEVEVEKRYLALDLKVALSRQRGGDEVERLKSSLEEREGLVTTLLGKIEALERDKEEMVAEVSKLRKEKSEESEKSCSANKALEAEKKRSEKIEASNFELVRSIGALERAINGIQDGVSKLNREKSEEVEKISKKKMIALAEKRAFEEESEKLDVLIKRIEALEKNNKEMKEKFSKANMEKDAEIRRGEDTEFAYGAHLVSNAVSMLDTPAAQNQACLCGGIINFEEQSTLASAHERIQPLSETLTGGESSNNSVALDCSATRKRTRSGNVKKL